MQVLLVRMRQCPRVAGLRPSGYLGYRLKGCERIEHLLATRDGVARVEAECRGCVLAELLQAGYVLSRPEVDEDGTIRFVVASTPQARRVLSRYRGQLLEARRIRLENALLTPRRREVLRLMAEETVSVSRLARSLGVSKPAALKLVKRAIRKLVLLHSP